jgi:hypothetical protein
MRETIAKEEPVKCEMGSYERGTNLKGTTEEKGRTRRRRWTRWWKRRAASAA